MMKSDHQEPNALDNMNPWKRYYFHKFIMNSYYGKVAAVSDEVIRSLSAPIICRDLDTTTLRELIDSEDRLIPKDQQPGVPRVAIPRPLRVSLQDCTRGWLIWRYARERLKGWLIGSHIIRTCMLEYLSTWLGLTVFYYKEPITHLVMLSYSVIIIISSTHLSQRSNSSRMMMSSVEMTQVGCVTACFGSCMF
nr:hypothetical protein [Tanacetum cinerariifolium]